MVASREWHYTGASRGEQLVFYIGDMSVVRKQIGRTSLAARKTLLVERLAASLPGPSASAFAPGREAA